MANIRGIEAISTAIQNVSSATKKIGETIKKIENDNKSKIETEEVDFNLDIKDNSYTVSSGDTMWAIAEKYLGDGSRYTELAKYNNIDNPSLIHPGQVIKIPSQEEQVQTTEIENTPLENISEENHNIDINITEITDRINELGYLTAIPNTTYEDFYKQLETFEKNNPEEYKNIFGNITTSEKEALGYYYGYYNIEHNKGIEFSDKLENLKKMLQYNMIKKITSS